MTRAEDAPAMPMSESAAIWSSRLAAIGRPLRFQAGGSLQPGALYVQRPADEELPLALLAGEYCYVLAPRQIGKSSLRVRAERVLRATGIRTVSIDLTRVGSHDSTPGQWYFGLIDEITRQLRLSDLLNFWSQHQRLSPVHRFTRYLHEQLLTQCNERIVLFIDEVDAIRSVPAVSRDDFFSAVRSLYNARVDHPELCRLAICFLGVALPSDLVADETKTPFNIGRSIVLSDFTPAEMDGFLPGLSAWGGEAHAILEEVFAWTDGHPYMAQRLCQSLVHDQVGLGRQQVQDLVGKLFLHRGRVLEANLAYSEKCFSRDKLSGRTAQMLQLYKQLIKGERILAEGQDPIQMALRLTGMAAEREEHGQTWLRIRNQIFAKTFDLVWIESKEGERRFAEPLARWLESNRNSDFLLRGEALQQATEWFQLQDDVTVDERVFLMAGLQAARLEAVEKERQERVKARTEMQRRNIKVLTVLLGLISVALTIALWQRMEASDAKRKAETANQIEKGLRAVLLSGKPGRQAEALLVGLQAVGPSLQQRQQPPPQAIEGLTTAVAAIAVVSSRVLDRHEDRVLGGAFSPNGQEVITASLDKTARIWDVASGNLRLKLVGHSAGVASACFSPDGRHVLTASVDKTAQIWDAQTGKKGVTLHGHTQRVASGAFSPDGRRIVTASFDATARIWDAATGECIRTLAGHSDWVMTAAFSPDGRQIITASWDATAKVWDADSGRLLYTLEGRYYAVHAAAFSPDGKRIVTASNDAAVRVWDANSQEHPISLNGHSGVTFSAAFSADGKRIITGGSDDTVRIWDIKSQRVILYLEGHKAWVRAVAFSPNGRYVLTVGDDHTARLWDTQQVSVLPSLDGDDGAIWAAEFSPDGQQVITAGSNNLARLWSAKDSSQLMTLTGHTGPVKAVAFSRDGQRVITGSSDRTARIWDLKQGRTLVSLVGHEGTVRSVMFSPDGERAITGSLDTTARIWDTRTGKLHAVLRGHTGMVLSARYSFDGRRVITGSSDSAVTGLSDNTARIWDAETGELLLTLRGHAKSVSSAEFSHDDHWVVTSSHDGTARVWDARSGKEIWVLRSNPEWVISARFSPDGKHIVTGSADHTIKVWRITGKQPEASFSLKAHESVINWVAFSPDGRWLVSASADGIARILPSTIEGFIQFGCRLQGNLQSLPTVFSKLELGDIQKTCQPYQDVF